MTIARRIPNKWFWITLLIPVALLLSLTVQPLQIHWFAEEIAIKTRPYDPKDLFYGDHVVLHYEIEEIPVSLFEETVIERAKANPARKFAVYVELEKKGDVHGVKRVVAEQPDGGTYLKGYLKPFSLDEDNGGLAHVEYKNIGRFYVEEHTGYDWEEKSRQGQIYAIVKVYKGAAVLKDIRTSV